MRRLNAKLRTAFVAIVPDALCALVDLLWKGNVRELENVLERAMVLGGGRRLGPRISRRHVDHSRSRRGIATVPVSLRWWR